MTPKTLATVGSALFGPTWQTRLANKIAVNDRTVRRWASGEMTIPATLRTELLILAEDRRAAIDDAIHILKTEE